MIECFAYSCFGLGIRSEIELPELAAGDRSVESDVVIALGPVPVAADPNTEFSINKQGAFLFIRGVARYWISGGSRIVIEPEDGVPMRNVRLFLLGSAMGALLHQRGLLPLHANAVEIGGRAFAFMGRSGAGKSTLAAAFHDRGHRVIADDVCVIRFDDEGRAFACPGIPRLRLWEEALTATGRTSGSYQPSYAGDESFRKFDVPIDWDPRDALTLPLAAIYWLAEGERIAVRKLEGSEAAEAIFANTYRGGFVRSAGDPLVHWSMSLNLILGTPVYELSRPWGLARFAEDLPQIVRLAEEVIRHRIERV